MKMAKQLCCESYKFHYLRLLNSMDNFVKLEFLLMQV